MRGLGRAIHLTRMDQRFSFARRHDVRSMRPLDDLRGGSPDVLAELYGLYGDMVYRTGLRIVGSREEAADVLQDVFVGLPEALRSFEGRGSLEGWIRQVAVRTSLMRLRALGRRAEVPLDAVAERAAVSPSPIARLTVDEALNRLPPSLRVVFVLKEIEGFEHAEIGRMLGITARASETRLHRARRVLRAWWSESR